MESIPTNVVDLDMDEEETEVEHVPEGSQSNPIVKRVRKLTSPCWTYFEIQPCKPGEEETAKCIKCGHIAKSASSQGTGNMNRHAAKCRGTSYRDVGQMLISQSNSTLSNKPSKFDPLVFRELLNMAIVRHDLPFQFVEYKGIREAFRYAGYANQDITLRCRNTAKADIVKMFHKEKGKIRKLLHSIVGRICLTSDLWTSLANDGYISLTAHFVDEEWKLQKRVINFSYMPSPHTGNAIADKIHTLLSEWGIERKLFSITLDNASSNLTFVSLLKTQLNLQNALLSNGCYFHIRCCCHIINLVVQEGLSVIDNSVLKIRESVKYFRGSQGRKTAFFDCVRQMSIPCKKGLRQDVSTRWDSTFYMLESAVYYRLAFVHLSLSDSNYKFCPTKEEWVKVQKICEFLKLFANVTKLFSGSSYPTSNLFFREMFFIQDAIKKAIASDDRFINVMGDKMKEKFGSYWSKHNIILAMAVVMDPRYKMNFVEYAFNTIYGKENPEIQKVRTKLNNLFDLYVSNFATPTTSSTPTEVSMQTEFHDTQHGNEMLKDFEAFESEGFEAVNQKSQLELYLLEPKMKISDKLEVLDFWKSNQFRYPELSRMARDILTIPVSTVASESAFSVGGRVIDQYRSALLPQNVEALVCTNDWLFKEKDVLAPTLEDLTEDVMKEMREASLSHQGSNVLTS